MSDFFASTPMLLMAILAGYLLGAVPLAYQISRRHGIDIFSTGTGLAGASNVRKHIGRVPAAIVMAGDLAKGALAILVGRFLGIEGPWILLPALAAIAGHWKSVFSGFRGGDGLATLGGITMALFPGYGVISVLVAVLVSLGGQKTRYTSLLSVVFGYLALVMLSIAQYGDMTLAHGCGGLAAVVLARAVIGHWRRRRVAHWDEVGEATEEPGLEPGAETSPSLER